MQAKITIGKRPTFPDRPNQASSPQFAGLPPGVQRSRGSTARGACALAWLLCIGGCAQLMPPGSGGRPDDPVSGFGPNAGLAAARAPAPGAVPGGTSVLVPDETTLLHLPGAPGALRIGRSAVFVDTADNRPPAGGFPVALARVRLDEPMREAIRTDASQAASAALVALVGASGDASLQLVPAATLHLGRNGAASLALRVTMQRLRPDGTAPRQRQYWYRLPGLRSLSGYGSWSEDDAAALQEACEAAIQRIVPIVLADLRGEFSARRVKESARTIRWRSGRSAAPASSLLLAESDTDLVVMPIVRDRPIAGIIAILDRDRVRLEGESAPNPVAVGLGPARTH